MIRICAGIVDISDGPCGCLYCEGFWETREGKIIHLNEMTNTHLKNAYKMFKDIRMLKELNRREMVNK